MVTLCINPRCTKPENLSGALFCQTCGAELLIEGRYRVKKVLGAGGCGKTYEVSDRSGGAKVLKVLIQKDAKYIELFQREATLLSQLNHPGIPKVEPGAYFTVTPKHSDEALHCLVMEKMVGLDLQQYLRQRGTPIDPKLALEWMSQICTILKTIHQQNILHRDIKPANIMLKSDGNLALVDFGAARSITLSTDQMGAAPATRVMTAMFTPDEQIRGYPVQQSDFFALGRTFVYLLTGRDLIGFYDPLTGEFNWHAAVPPLLPSLINLIDRLMAPLPIHRPAQADEILHHIQAIQQEFSRNSRGNTQEIEPTELVSVPAQPAAQPVAQRPTPQAACGAAA